MVTKAPNEAQFCYRVQMFPKENKNSIPALVVLISLTLSAGLIGSSFKPGSWYQQIVKPSWTPPNWLFAPVWATLYLLMGISSWLIWRHQSEGRLRALSVFFAQLALNSLWSWIFFGMHQVGLALIEMCLLWTGIALTIGMFNRISRPAAVLLVPYLAWVSYALSLNFGIWWLNS